MKEVSGTVEVNWTVRLPEGQERNKKGEGLCEDPAIEAVIEFLPQMGKVFLRGEDQEPVEVYLEIHEEDVEIEDDERGET